MGPALRAGERKLHLGSNPSHAIGEHGNNPGQTVSTALTELVSRPAGLRGARLFFRLYSTVVVRLTCNQKVLSSILNGGSCCDVRVVKEIDLKSIGLCPRRFKSCSQRLWGISSNGRALALHARGSGIDAHILQEKINGRLV